MDTELKARWVEALRSGRYIQGKHALRSAEDKYCCLGVLCDIVAPDGWGPGPGPGCNYEHRYKDVWDSAMLTPTLRIHIRELMPFRPADESRLAKMNDNNQTFEEIADWIERNL